MKTLLTEISEELSSRIRKIGRIHSFVEGREIFAEGDEALHLPIVLSGKVKMVHFLEPGKEVIIGIFGTGEMFAVPAVFDGGDYPAAAFTMERSKLLLIERTDFLALLRDSSEFSFEVINWMSSMLREKTATIQNLATASPDHRIGKVLLKLANGNAADGPVKITLRREDIANMAGLTTETTIRVIRRMSDRGLFKIIHGKVLIDDISLLDQAFRD
jgi:CRP/FNR family transcriptional regulator